MTAGFPGNGTLGHITGKLLQERSSIKSGETQYRGSTPIITDLLGGHIDLAMNSMAAYVPQVREGKLRDWRLPAAERSPAYPMFHSLRGGAARLRSKRMVRILAPTGTPAQVIAKLNAATNEFLKTAQAKEVFEKLGIDVAGGSPNDLRPFSNGDRKVGSNHQECKYRVLKRIMR